MMSSVTVIGDHEFETQVLKAEQPVLVYFWAPWCGPCKLVSPSLDGIASNYGDRLKVVKLEIDSNPVAVKQCKIEGVPAIRLFKGSEVILAYEGAITKQKLLTLLNEHL